MAEDDGSGGIEYTDVDMAHMSRRWAEHQLEAPARASGAGDGFMVDPDSMEACIASMARIEDQVLRSLMAAGSLRFDPPGNDEVSVNLAQNGQLMAARAEAFVQTWAGQIRVAREAMQAQLGAYRAADADNASRLA